MKMHNLTIFLLFKSIASKSTKTKVSQGPDYFDEDMPISSSFKSTPLEKTKKR